MLALLAGCDDGDGAAPAGADGPDAPAQDAGVEAAADGATAEAAPEATAEDGAVEAPAAYPRPQYQRLSETGLYADLAARTVAPGNREFRPTHQLWSDAADKRRWLRLPEGARIDTSEIDHWQFPVGTKVWKEFARQGAALETRLIERYGPGPEDYWMGAFVWAADGADATFVEAGIADINGSTHDAPAARTCLTCHRGEKGRLLGLSAIQLAHEDAGGELTLARLVSEGRLSHPPAALDYQVPGDADTAAALGYLHANCGNCHNRNGSAWPDTQAVMRLGWEERTAEGTAIYHTLVGQRFTYWRHPTLTLRIAPGDGESSAVLVRMKLRGSKEQMPPLATEIVDPAGVDILARWIAALPAAAATDAAPTDAADAGAAAAD
jgi:hypothetical protein